MPLSLPKQKIRILLLENVNESAVRLFDALFPLDMAFAPSAHLDYLQFPCVVDGARAHVELGFAPRYSTRDTLVEYGQTALRDAA